MVAMAPASGPMASTAPVSGDAAICAAVADQVSRRTGVPLAVLRAIALTETGRKRSDGFQPWPWTVNMEGKGYWFDTVDDARAYVYKEYKRGARSFDIGCFQINYRWHGDAFASIDQMFDPVSNGLYAAQLLGQLYGETGSWGAAAGAYHSRTPALAAEYQKRFERILAGLVGGAGADTALASGQMAPDDIPEIPDIVLAMNGDSGVGAEVSAPRVNTYPLLLAGAGGSGFGSLMPLGTGGGASLFPASATDVAASDPAARTDAPETIGAVVPASESGAP